MESKWLAVMMIGIVVAGMGGVAVESYAKNQCKLAYTQSTKSAEEITKICK